MTHRPLSRSRRLPTVAVLLLLTGIACRAKPGLIRGLVKVDGVPAPGIGVLVETDDSSEETTTGSDGVYEIEVPNGNATVSVAVPDDQYQCVPPRADIRVKQDETTQADFNCARQFAATVTGGYNHTQPGVESVECKRITTAPAMPGATYSMTVEGPIGGTTGSGVIPGQSFTGSLGPDGTARIQVRINKLGTYRNTITVTSQGNVVRSGVLDVPVTGAASSCP
ncbi:MAG: hypothetical protein HOP28_15010 [Gemmatimonadales bacterium]|nr:hypothetical protein [Gemmatimonadales bacterium]